MSESNKKATTEEATIHDENAAQENTIMDESDSKEKATAEESISWGEKILQRIVTVADDELRQLAQELAGIYERPSAYSPELRQRAADVVVDLAREHASARHVVVDSVRMYAQHLQADDSFPWAYPNSCEVLARICSAESATVLSFLADRRNQKRATESIAQVAIGLIKESQMGARDTVAQVIWFSSSKERYLRRIASRMTIDIVDNRKDHVRNVPKNSGWNPGGPLQFAQLQGKNPR